MPECEGDSGDCSSAASDFDGDNYHMGITITITFSSSAGSFALVSTVEVVVVVVVEDVLCLRLSFINLPSTLSFANLVSPLSFIEPNLVSPLSNADPNLSLVESHLAVESWERDGEGVVVERLRVLQDTVANNWGTIKFY